MSALEWIGILALIVIAYRSLIYAHDRYPVFMMRLAMRLSDRKRWKEEQRNEQR